MNLQEFIEFRGGLVYHEKKCFNITNRVDINIGDNYGSEIFR